jgi:hypothetical protein
MTSMGVFWRERRRNATPVQPIACRVLAADGAMIQPREKQSPGIGTDFQGFFDRF